MNKKGFVFLETIITIVVLATTLIFLYSNFNKVLTNEKERLYYDDTAYLYKTIMIRDALLNSVNEEKFTLALNDSSSNFSLVNNLAYGFGSEQKYQDESIYDNNLLDNLYDLYKFKTLFYIKIKDIGLIKKCINENDIDSAQDQERCENFKKQYTAYSDFKNFKEYLKTLDESDMSSSDDGDKKNSILISLFYESKDGQRSYDDNFSQFVYRECISEKINLYNEKNNTSLTYDSYISDDSINFSMSCQNAYYYSWVYYD